jgi:hypothetical protein
MKAADSFSKKEKQRSVPKIKLKDLPNPKEKQKEK